MATQLENGKAALCNNVLKAVQEFESQFDIPVLAFDIPLLKSERVQIEDAVHVGESRTAAS